MKQAGRSEKDDMRAEYDFSAGKKNPFAAGFARGANIVRIKPELFAAFPSEQAVNEALRTLLDSKLKTARGLQIGDVEQSKAS